MSITQAPPHPSYSFKLREARQLVGDLFVPRPGVYWCDFLTTVVLGHSSFVLLALLSYRASIFPWPGLVALAIVLFMICCLSYYRAAMFIHELVHIHPARLPGFHFAWNLLFGIPLQLPSFLYDTHRDHHRRDHYGTPQDGEYLPFEHRGRLHILFYLAQSFVIPILALIRFGLLPPLGWVSRRIRRWIHRRASSMIIDPDYVREESTEDLPCFRFQEFACFCWLWGMIAVLVFCLGGSAWWIAGQIYLVAVAAILINSIRTLGAHRYGHDGRALTYEEQMLDSVNYPKGGVLTAAWAPVGTRYHALHHLFPSLPYHALPEAHRRLMAQLPAESSYRRTEAASLFSTLRDLWKRASNAHKVAPGQREE